MTHPIVAQFLFTRTEWLRGLTGLTEEEGSRHFGQMNCISWTVGHLAWHEQKYWLERAQNIILLPDLNNKFAFGSPMSTPSLKEMLAAWRKVSRASTASLEALDSTGLSAELLRKGKPVGQTLGSAMYRIIYHYWYHIGEIQAVRQMLGHQDLPVYVGNLEKNAPYTP
jgi:uncharacterized damage-inducible protein DinB